MIVAFLGAGHEYCLFTTALLLKCTFYSIHTRLDKGLVGVDRDRDETPRWFFGTYMYNIYQILELSSQSEQISHLWLKEVVRRFNKDEQEKIRIIYIFLQILYSLIILTKLIVSVQNTYLSKYFYHYNLICKTTVKKKHKFKICY